MLKEAITLDLTVGSHNVTFAVDRTERNDPLRVELDDVPGSAARVRVVSGK